MFVEYCSAKLDCISHRHRLGAVRRLCRAIQRRLRFRFHITLCARQVSDHRADVRSERSRRGTPLQTFADTGRCRRFPVRSPSLQHAKPARTEFAVADLLQVDPLESYGIGSPIVNVILPGHGYSTADTKRFRGATGVSGNYNDPAGVGGITGATIAKAAGYTITVGKYISGATDTSGTNATDWFWFSADTNATSVATGGGFPISVGPVTLSA